ncbi:HNH endonuclease [Streptomyces sp. NPDC020707]|uniref:HNH endonuclease n=1 Tax=Streptomyces sp. NPDC020707 TaxID=3365084 RepID=UPI003787680D
MNDNWKEHPDFPGYFVSSAGQVRGRRGWIMKPETITGGYQRLVLAKKHRLIHVLVAEVFLGSKPEGHQVNHKDGDTANNAVSNLEYVTPSANVRHSLDVLGVQRAKGSENGQSRLTEKQVSEARATFAQGGITRTALARQYGVHVSTMCRAINGTRWAHVEVTSC